MKKLLLLFLFNNFLHTELFQDNSHIVQDDGSLTPGEEDSYLKIIYDSIKLSDKKLITLDKYTYTAIIIFIEMCITYSHFLIYDTHYYDIINNYHYNNLLRQFIKNILFIKNIFCVLSYIVLSCINLSYFIKKYIKETPKRKKIEERMKSLKSRLNNIKNLPIYKKFLLENEVDINLKGKINAYKKHPSDDTFSYKNFDDVIEDIIKSFIMYNNDEIIINNSYNFWSNTDYITTPYKR